MFLRCVSLAVPLVIATLAPAFGQAPPVAQATAPADEESFIDADRPGFADTSTVVGKGWIQLEAGIQHEARGNTGFRQRALFFPMLLRVGVTERVELRIEGNSFTRLTQPDAADAEAVIGLAPFSAGFKWQVHEAAGIREPGLGLIGRAVPRWGTGDLRARRYTGDVRLAIDWAFASKFSLNPNAGIGWYEGADGLFATGVFAMTLTYVPATRVSVFVDIGLQTPEADRARTGATVDAGIAYFPAHDVQLDFSAGTRAIGSTGPHPFVAAGVSLRGRAWGRRKSG